MTKPSDSLTGQKRAPRKSTIWTREKISQLIELYRKSDCLWNHYIEDYKSKECRNKAIEEICKTLNISKFDFGKKIHNLRNQFNSEMKKLERRIEVSGGNIADMAIDGANIATLAGKKCRWEHFETLMFLRTVIEPRPGYQFSTTNSPPNKKLRTKVDCQEDTSDLDHGDNTTSGYEESSHVAEQSFANCLEETRQEVTCEHKYLNPMGETPLNNYTTAPNTPTTTGTNLFSLNSAQQKSELDSTTGATAYSELTNTQITQLSAHIDPVTHNLNKNNTTTTLPTVVASTNALTRARDEWDAFGETIASELRNLNSDHSRKKLKRIIMQAMLEIGREDDRLSVGVN